MMRTRLFLWATVALVPLALACNADDGDDGLSRAHESISPDDLLGGTVDISLTGEWRVYSETLFYDAGGSGGSDSGASTTRMLVLKDDGAWEFGSSGGSWYVTSIDPSDWDRWGSAPYGPERKIVLEGWNGDMGDGPVEEYEGGIDFFWVIYRVDAPYPGTVQMKFGHA